MDNLPRVVYLSSGRDNGETLKCLRTFPCEIAVWTTDDNKIEKWPGYDLGLNFLATRKIGPKQLKVPRLGWVNFHPAPLPELRGRNLAYWAISLGYHEFGATVHYMDETYDTGELIEVSRFPIEKGDTAGDLVQKSVESLVLLFKKWVPRLLEGKVPTTPQGEGRYFEKCHIPNEISLNFIQERQIRAATVHPKHYSVVVIGGRRYKIIPEGEK